VTIFEIGINPFSTASGFVAQRYTFTLFSSPQYIIRRDFGILQLSPFTKKMIKHIVMWKLKAHAEGANKASNALKMKSLLDACSDIVPGILAFETAIAQAGLEATFDVVLYSAFINKAALDAYQVHPQHQALKPFIAAVREDRQCMDYAL
jgi:hypothetical protein